MAISPQLARALQHALGNDASEELVTLIGTSSADIAEMRHEMQIGFVRVDARFDQVRADLVERIERRYSDLMKWSFVFWVGAVTTIAVLFRTLR